MKRFFNIENGDISILGSIFVQVDIFGQTVCFEFDTPDCSCPSGYLGSLQLDGGLLLPLLAALSRSLALAGALALDLSLQLALLLQRDI